jgi:GTP-binding protein HflX
MEKTILVHLSTEANDRLEARDSMRELQGLARTAGAEIVREIYQVRSARHPRTYVGEGKVNEIRRLMKELQADMVVFDHVLSPVQQRSLEDRIPGKVIDRTRLILDIFAQRARSREGRLQVELAQLNYLLPRLTGKGTAMSRLGGGIGTRGPGETKLEEDRRRIQKRIAAVRRSLEKIQRQRFQQRKSRVRGPVPTVSLVGYTNAGKSTLFNRLTQEHMLASPRLFSTLDPVVRRVSFPDGLFFFLSDTVGLIKHLPVELKTAFRATLEETAEADCIVHVVDITSPHSQAHILAVETVLRDLGASEIPRLTVFNKIDLLPDRKALLAHNRPANSPAVYLSAESGDGLPALIKALHRTLFRRLKRFILKIPKSEAGAAASFPKWAFVLKRREHADSYEFLVLAEPKSMLKYVPYIQRGEAKW